VAGRGTRTTGVARRRRRDLTRSAIALQLLFCIALLVGGVLNPMIEVEAKISKISLTFFGQSFSFPEQVLYYDLPRYEPFWDCLERLDVPFYLHPRNPLPAWAQIYDGHPWLLGPTWAFGQETAVHALRLMACGLFDRHPRIQIVLGHMGEGLPYSMWRIDNRNAWVKAPKDYPAKRTFGEYFQSNFHLTETPQPHQPRCQWRDKSSWPAPSQFGGWRQ